MVSLQLVHSSVTWSLTPVQLICNSHYANICNNFTTEISLGLVCDDLAVSLLWVFGRGELTLSLQQMSSQLLCNCFAASSQLPHSHISFACRILFAVISPWSSSDLATIVATPHFFTWVFPASVLSPHSDFIEGGDVHSLMPCNVQFSYLIQKFIGTTTLNTLSLHDHN